MLRLAPTVRVLIEHPQQESLCTQIPQYFHSHLTIVEEGSICVQQRGSNRGATFNGSAAYCALSYHTRTSAHKVSEQQREIASDVYDYMT